MANKIKISDSEPIKYSRHDFQLGDYVYAPVSISKHQGDNEMVTMKNHGDFGLGNITRFVLFR